MTVSEETKEREEEKLLVTDAELIRRVGVPVKIGRRALRRLEQLPIGFPKKLEIWGDRRWWPHVKLWMDSYSGMFKDGAARPATENRDNRTRLPRPSSMRQHPAEGLND